MQRLRIEGYDEVYRLDLGGTVGFLALHRVIGGLAVGGIRIADYPDETRALQDCLDLARAMSRKNAMARIPIGGGKVVIVRPGEGRADAVRRVGEAMNALGGRFRSGADYGFGPEDDRTLAAVTPYIACSGLAAFTSTTVRLALEAVCEPRRVVVQGLGAVGLPLAEALRDRGVQVLACDLHEVAGFENVADPWTQEADVFAPCARGGVLDADTIPRLRVRVVCGAANNPLASEEDGWRLHRRGILYVPDFVANSGATIRGTHDLLEDPAPLDERLNVVPETVREVVARSRETDRPTAVVAREIADERLLAHL